MSSNIARYVGIAAAAAAASVSATFALPETATDLHFRAASAFGPLLRLLDAETAHRVGIWAAAAGLFPKAVRPDDARLQVSVWGKTFSNPIGVAAGFDKDAEAIDGLLGMGLGFTEIGSVTPEPQPGNPKPRCFRLVEHEAIINRYGFNSAGADAARERLATFRDRHAAARDPEQPAGRGLLFVNLGKNKLTEDAAADYCIGVEKLSQFADVLVINISSPNTPGLRALQGKEQLQRLIRSVQQAMDRTSYSGGRPPLVIKIAPDLTDADKDDIAAVALANRVDGLLVGNTTLSRPGDIEQHPHGTEAGGLSGAPLFDLSTQALRDMYVRTRGEIPLIGCGGVSSGKQAYAKIRAGASLVELYTGLVYHGPALVPAMKQELLACMEADGFSSVQDAIAADHPRVVVSKAAPRRWWKFWST